jgi:predicted AAA+ superfamily ATPase
MNFNNFTTKSAEAFDQVSYFAGKNKEIDFVIKHQGNLRYFEVKYQNKVQAGEFKETKQMLGANNLTVITKQDFESRGAVKLIPMHQFLFSSV